MRIGKGNGGVQLKSIDSKYAVGNDGVIYADGGALVAIGGVGVNLHGERKKIAYLVARAWVPNPECRPYVRHVNGDVTDNRPCNLEWCEEREYRRRGKKSASGWCSAFRKNGELVGRYGSPLEGAVALGVDVRYVLRCLRGQLRSSGGYLWRWGW